MKKVNRILTCMVIILMLVLSISSCGKSESAKKEEEKAGNAQATEEEKEETEEEKESVEEESSNEESKEVQQADFSQVVYDENGVKFEITGVDTDGFWGYTWNVYLENNTDKTLMYSVDGVSINGMMCDPFWASDVAPGKKENTDISWSDSTLEKSGIDDVTMVEFNLRVKDSEDFMAEPIVDDTFTVYPKGEDAAVTIERTSADGDIVLFDNDKCSMTIIGFDPDDFMGYAMKAYLVNKSDSSLMFAAESGSINGFMADPFWAESVAPGKKAVTDITWMNSTLEDNKIDKVEDIEIKIHVYDDENYTGDYFVDETFTVKPTA